MRASVAQAAIGSAVIAGFARLPVNATRILPSLVLMAGATDRFGNVGWVRILVVRLVAGVASQAGMSALLELRGLVMTGGTVCGSEGRRNYGSGSQQEEKRQKGLLDAAPNAHG